MFETGMSALVLKICSEYAKSLGLNFPPCTQQEINAICEWVDKHTIKDMTISQDGYNVTFTFKTENDVTKEFTFTIPKAVDIDELEKVLKGSDSVVVDRLIDNSGLQVSLAQSVVNDINSKLTKPTTPTAESAVTMLADGTVGTKLLSEIGGGGKLYCHDVLLEREGSVDTIYVSIINNTSDNITMDYIKRYLAKTKAVCYSGEGGDGVVSMQYHNDIVKYYIKGLAYNPIDSSHPININVGDVFYISSQTLTEL